MKYPFIIIKYKASLKNLAFSQEIKNAFFLLLKLDIKVLDELGRVLQNLVSVIPAGKFNVQNSIFNYT